MMAECVVCTLTAELSLVIFDNAEKVDAIWSEQIGDEFRVSTKQSEEP